jgi:hypothetical protein
MPAPRPTVCRSLASAVTASIRRDEEGASMAIAVSSATARSSPVSPAVSSTSSGCWIGWVALTLAKALSRCPSSVTTARCISLYPGPGPWETLINVPAATLRAVGKYAPGFWLHVPLDERSSSLGGSLSRATRTYRSSLGPAGSRAHATSTTWPLSVDRFAAASTSPNGVQPPGDLIVCQSRPSAVRPTTCRSLGGRPQSARREQRLIPSGGLRNGAGRATALVRVSGTSARRQRNVSGSCCA